MEPKLNASATPIMEIAKLKLLQTCVVAFEEKVQDTMQAKKYEEPMYSLYVAEGYGSQDYGRGLNINRK